MKRSVIFKIIFFSLITILVYLFINYRGTINDVKYLESSSFSKNLEFFILKKNRIPQDAIEVLNFIKKRDVDLYNGLKNIKLEFIKHDKHSFSFYLRGFDNVDNLLKNKYNINDIGFINSLFKKGDIELNLFFKFKQKANVFYKIGESSLIESDNFSLFKVYKEYFNCENIIRKTLDYEEVNSVQLRIYNREIEIFDNSLSDETLNIYLDEIKESKYFKDKNNIYILYIRSNNIDLFKCGK